MHVDAIAILNPGAGPITAVHASQDHDGSSARPLSKSDGKPDGSPSMEPVTNQAGASRPRDFISRFRLIPLGTFERVNRGVGIPTGCIGSTSQSEKPLGGVAVGSRGPAVPSGSTTPRPSKPSTHLSAPPTRRLKVKRRADRDHWDDDFSLGVGGVAGWAVGQAPLCPVQPRVWAPLIGDA